MYTVPRVLSPEFPRVLVEDVVTTGGTLIKVIERVENEGFKVGLVVTRSSTTGRRVAQRHWLRSVIP